MLRAALTLFSKAPKMTQNVEGNEEWFAKGISF
jgi:hypothetical protein